MPDKYYRFAKALYLKDIKIQEPKLFEPCEILAYGSGLKDRISRLKPVIGATL